MMNDQILHYLAMFFGAVLYTIVAWIVFKFLLRLGKALCRQALIFINYVAYLLIKSTSPAGRYLKALLIECLSLVFNVIRGAWMSLYQPCFLAARDVSCAVRQYVKLRQLFWKYGRQEFATFGQFKRHMLGEEEPPPKAKPEKPAHEKSGYAQALEILGFSETAPLDKTMLKARHRELAKILHPDKEFPNQVFMQQVNDAVDYIKRAKKWR